MDFKIDLSEELRNEARAGIIINKVKASMVEFVSDANKALKAADNANKLAEEYQKQTAILTKSNIDLMQALKNVHSVLGAKSDMFKGDEDFKVLMDSLATFVLGSSAIKAGVLNESIK